MNKIILVFLTAASLMIFFAEGGFSQISKARALLSSGSAALLESKTEEADRMLSESKKIFESEQQTRTEKKTCF